MNLLDDTQVLLKPTKTCVIKQQLAVDLVHSVLDVNDELEPLKQVFAELILGLAAPYSDVAQLLVILLHDHQLVSM